MGANFNCRLVFDRRKWTKNGRKKYGTDSIKTDNGKKSDQISRMNSGLIEIEVYFGEGKRVYLSTGHKCRPAEWDKVRQQIKTSVTLSNIFNHDLKSAMEKIGAAFEYCESSGQKWNKEFLLEYMSTGLPSKNRKLKEFINDCIEEEKHTVTSSTLQTWKAVIKHLDEFKPDAYLKDVDTDFLRSFRLALQKKKLAAYTVQKQLKKLRKFIGIALTKELIQKNPFNGFTIGTVKTTREFLTFDELERLITHKIQNKRLDNIRNQFLFMCMTGLAFSDIGRLKHSRIFSDPGGKFISIQRQKTGEPAMIPLNDLALKILQKVMIENPDLQDFVFPRISNQKFNSYLHELESICNISKSLTSHLGRHTFGTLAINQGLGIDTVARILGHSNTKTTRIYAKLQTDFLFSEMQKIDNSQGMKKLINDFSNP